MRRKNFVVAAALQRGAIVLSLSFAITILLGWEYFAPRRISNMTVEDFRQSLSAAQPPIALTLALVGLWWDAKGDWKRAHESAQQDESPEGSRVHAYLHRREGDQSNAVYWYGRAGKPVFQGPLDAEWLDIVGELLR